MGKAKVIPRKGHLLLPYQTRWVNDRSRLKLAEKSRQIGWTWATAFGLVRRKAFTNTKLDAWISSRDEAQARLFIEDCRQFASRLDPQAREIGRVIVADARESSRVLQFANLLRIHSLSSNPNAQAGKRGDRILDEFALHSNPHKLYTIAHPGTTWGGSLEIFSTHRGNANFFNKLIEEIKHKGNPKGFSFHSVSLEGALNAGFLHKLQENLPPDDPRQEMDEADYFNDIRRTCADEESFLQEFCCLPGDDHAAFLSYDHIAACEYSAGDEWEWNLDRARDSNAHLYIGVDVGRARDLTVIWILEATFDLRLTRKVIVLDRQSFDAQEYELYSWLELPQVRRACIDQTGIGRQFAERACKRFGTGRVEGINFTSESKEILAFPVRGAFEERRLRIPADKHIRADLRSIRKEATLSGNIRFSADVGRDGHADRFWALALAIHAVGSGPRKISVRALPVGRPITTMM